MALLGALDLVCLVMVCCGLCSGVLLRGLLSGWCTRRLGYCALDPPPPSDLALARRGVSINLRWGDVIEAGFPFMARDPTAAAAAHAAAAAGGAIVGAFSCHSSAYLPLPLALAVCRGSPLALAAACAAAFSLPAAATFFGQQQPPPPEQQQLQQQQYSVGDAGGAATAGAFGGGLDLYVSSSSASASASAWSPAVTSRRTNSASSSSSSSSSSRSSSMRRRHIQQQRQHQQQHQQQEQQQQQEPLRSPLPRAPRRSDLPSGGGSSQPPRYGLSPAATLDYMMLINSQRPSNTSGAGAGGAPSPSPSPSAARKRRHSGESGGGDEGTRPVGRKSRSRR